MKESSAIASVTTLDQGLIKGGISPEELGWKVKILEVGANHVVQITNPDRGVLYQGFVKAVSESGEKSWDQIIFEENPGVVMMPYRKFGKKGTSPKYLLYMITVQRPVVRCELNFYGSKKKIAVYGATLIEFPRGIGEYSKIRFNLAPGWQTEKKKMFVSEEQLFAQSGGLIELSEEVPQLSILKGGKPRVFGMVNPNSAYFSTNQGLWLVPVSEPEDKEDISANAISLSAKEEQITGIIPIEWPSTTDILLREAEEIASGKKPWDPRKPVLVDGFTLACLAQFERCVREGSLIFTG